MNDSPRPISESDLRRMMMDPAVPDVDIAPYLCESRLGSTSFAPVVVPNSAVVTPGLEEGAVLLSSVNSIARWRRRMAYRRRIKDWTGPRLVSEGDSWFQYPLLLADVIDQLGSHYAICSLGAPGDLLADIETQDELISNIAVERPDAVLISGGGNDLLGEGRLVQALKPFDPALTRPADYVTEAFERTLADVLDLYRSILIRVRRTFPDLPVFCHGYDHAIPSGGRWLGQPLARLNIDDPALQRALVAHLVDRFYDDMNAMLAAPVFGGQVEMIDCRGLVGGDWHDELHPNDAGYARVAELFNAHIEARIGRRESVPVAAVEAPVGLGSEAVPAPGPGLQAAAARTTAATARPSPGRSACRARRLPA